MTVEQFVALRREPWQRLSDLCDRLEQRGVTALASDDLATFGPLYQQTASDLAYASTHLGQAELLAYLNRLVVRAHGQLYRAPRRDARRLTAFFTSYPSRWRAATPYLVVAAATLFAGWLVAFVAVRQDPRQASLFLPVELTAQLPTSPGATVPSSAFVAVSGFVLVNNLTAAVVAFATGLLFGLGSLAALLRNGLLLGGLTGLAAATPGSLLTFTGLLAPHGVLELAALVTSGAAGLRLGHSLLAGGRLPRLAALQQAGGEAVRLLLGCLPWFVLAALIEGLLTPLPVPTALKLACGGLSAVVLGGYLAGGRQVGVGST